MPPFVTPEYKEKLEKLLNDQLNIEMFATYFYMSCYQYCNQRGITLPFIGQFFQNQYYEEIKHAQGIVDYMNSLNYKIDFQKIEIPKEEYKNIEEVFQKSLEYETLAYKSILNLYCIAEENHDHSTTAFLDAYVKEQVKAEKEFDDFLTMAKLCEGDKFKYFMLDKRFKRILADKGVLNKKF
ncbi:Ferritin heavy chain B [Cucumispora dikerogammari]|nr:Ferritin heavy chain B [Cucumispora dikerogammari]